MSVAPKRTPSPESFRPRSDVLFYLSFGIIGGTYIVLIVLMLVAEGSYSTVESFTKALGNRNVQYSIRLSLLSCTLTTILSLWVAVPIGYLMSRHNFRGKAFIDAVLDIPIVLPPLVIGLCLLIMFQTPPGKAVEAGFERITEYLFGRKIGITFEVPSVILAQFMVACAFAVRTMRVTFDQIHPRYEKVALTLGCNQSQAFWLVIFPQASRGLLAAATLAWARSLGEFGPILIFSGATHMKTEVLPTTVYLEMQVGSIEGAAAASLIMVIAAMAVLIVARVFGLKRMAI
ncbi:MAG: ABC transporter permease [Planctomycetaceae bacterium]